MAISKKNRIINQENNPEIYIINPNSWAFDSITRVIAITAAESAIEAGMVMTVSATGALEAFDAGQSTTQPLYVLARPIEAGDTQAVVIMSGLLKRSALKLKTGDWTSRQDGLDLIDRICRYTQIRIFDDLED